MHWFLQEDDEGLVKFEGDGKLAEDQAVRFTANSIIVADIEAKNDKVNGWCVCNSRSRVRCRNALNINAAAVDS